MQILEPPRAGRPAAAPSPETGPAQAEVQEQAEDTKHQDITYWKYGRFERVDARLMRPIDLAGAKREAGRLLWEHSELVGFSNGGNGDAVNVTRTGEDSWRVEEPIFGGGEWDGYYWGADADTEAVMYMLEMFFDELDWRSGAGFKMSRGREGPSGVRAMPLGG